MELPDDVVEEILLHFPPADPASLVRAALVCKPWCRIVCGPSFRRRLMGFHRTAPLLGFLCNPLFARFVPTSSFRPPQAGRELSLLHDREEEVRECIVVDARHGLVLLYFVLGDDIHEDDALVIWDPATGERWEIQIPILDICEREEWYATVLRAPTANGTAFIVVCVVTKVCSYSQGQRWYSRVYSSVSASWSEPTLIPKCSVDLVPTALMGNTLYFSIDDGRRILGFDLVTSETSVIRLPRASKCATALMEMEGGGLGFARVDVTATLSLWSMEVNPNRGIGMGWRRIRVIDLENLLPVDADSISYGFLGFAHGVDIFFMGTSDGALFSFDLKSGLVRKVYEGECHGDGLLSRVPCVVPYRSFCTPALRLVATKEEPEDAASPRNKKLKFEDARPSKS